MVNVLLIAPLTKEHTGIYNYGSPAPGVHRIAGWLRKHGVNTDVYDCNIDDFDKYRHKSYDIIGFSVLHDTLIFTIEFSYKLKECWPKALLIAGGIEATLNYQDIFDNSPITICVLVEGEQPLLDLCMNKPLHEIKGIVFKNNAEPISDDKLEEYYLEYPFKEAGHEKYWEYTKLLVNNPELIYTVRIITSSHCNKRCSFCSVSWIREFAYGKIVKPATMSMNKIDELLAKIEKELPQTKTIYFGEDEFITSEQRIDDFVEISKNHNFKYLIQTTTTRLTKSIIEKLAKAGVKHITCGVESCSDRLRKEINKSQKSEHIEEIIDWCNEYNIKCYYLVILFLPQTTIGELWNDVTILNNWRERGVDISTIPYVIPYRGCPYYNDIYDFEYIRHKLPNGRYLKQPIRILPYDKKVRTIMYRWDEVYADKLKESKQNFKFKLIISKIMIDALKDVLMDPIDYESHYANRSLITNGYSDDYVMIEEKNKREFWQDEAEKDATSYVYNSNILKII